MLLANFPERKYPMLAICPFRTYGIEERWVMKAFRLYPSGVTRWRPHLIEPVDGRLRADIYTTLEEAAREAERFNASMPERFDAIDLPAADRESLLLKTGKEVTALLRRSREEQLMLTEGIRRHESDPRPLLDDVKIAGSPGKVIQASLHAVLKETPYVDLASLPRFNIALVKKDDGMWRQVASNKKTLLLCFREKIAKAFDLSVTDHWGRTKATIRSILLPRANQLLQLASIQKILRDAEARGLRVVVIGEFVLWYEGASAQWVVKVSGGESSSEGGNTVWYKGTILSKNHGRIVVLPYIKENGERVQGHTKNGPNDGRAIPRHPDEYVALPFEVLEGDLMIGLFGELPYE